MADQTWTADRRLYLDKDGRVVEANDPTRRTLLVPQGGSLPIAQARALGLVTEEVSPAHDAGGNPTKTAPANKVAAPATETKDAGAGAGEVIVTEQSGPVPDLRGGPDHMTSEPIDIGEPSAPSIPRRGRR